MDSCLYCNNKAVLDELMIEFGDVFAMNPKQTYLTDAVYAERIEQIRKAIRG